MFEKDGESVPENKHTPNDRELTTREATSGRYVSPALYYGYTLSQKEKPLREYLDILSSHWLLILLSALVGFAIGLQRNQKNVEYFESHTLVNIGSYVPPMDGPIAEALRYETIKDEYVDSITPLLKSYKIARQVLLNNKDIFAYFHPPALQEQNKTGEKQQTSGAVSAPSESAEEDLLNGEGENVPVSLLDAYLGQISFVNLQGTSLVRIIARANTGKTAAKLANTHASAFISLVREQRMAAAIVNVDFLKERMIEAQQRAEAGEKKLVTFAKAHGLSLSNSSNLSDVNAKKFDGLISHLSEAVLERAHTEGELRELRRSTSVQNMRMDGNAWTAFAKLQELETNYNAIRRQNSSHPVLPVIRRQMRNLKKALKLSAKQEIRDREIRNKAAVEKERLLRGEFERLKVKEQSQAEQKLEFSILERENKAAKELVKQFRERLDDAAINAESDQKTVTLVDPAIPPAGPANAKRSSNLLAGFLLGALIGIALAVFLDMQDGSVKTLTDLREVVSAPVLAMIPLFPKKFEAKRRSLSTEREEPAVLSAEDGESADIPLVLGSPEDNFTDVLDRMTGIENASGQEHEVESASYESYIIVADEPFSVESESFRNLRATLRFSMRHEAPRVILVTSGQKGDGKTTIAVNLAASLAQTTARTLLVDADLRIPSVHKHFQLSRKTQGLSDYLAAPHEAELHIMESDIANLCVLCAGSPTTSPSELLSTDKMEQVVTELSNEFEYVVIDTPPVGEIADALIISQLVDSTLLVVRSGITAQNAVQLAYNRLRQVGANVLGTVFNGVRRQRGYYKSVYGPYASKEYTDSLQEAAKQQ